MIEIMINGVVTVHSMDMVANQVDGGIVIAITSTSTTTTRTQKDMGLYI